MKPLPSNVLQKESYLAMINNAEGTRLFCNLYAEVDGESHDILDDGQKSCAVFVSSVLYLWRLCETPHATVASLECDLVASGWKKREGEPEAGDVTVWEPLLQAGSVNAHIGFALGGGEAMSNDWQTGIPARHHLTYGTTPEGEPVRAITAVYTYDFVS